MITPDNQLIAGRRRLEAVRSLGWTEVPVRVVNIEAIVYGEREENTARKDFVPSEAVAIRKACLELERKEAKERQGTRTDKHPGNLPEGSTGRARDKSSRGTGYAARTLDKAAEIVEAAEAEPEKYARLVADMDRTGRVDGPFKRLAAARAADTLLLPAGAPAGRPAFYLAPGRWPAARGNAKSALVQRRHPGSCSRSAAAPSSDLLPELSKMSASAETCLSSRAVVAGSAR